MKNFLLNIFKYNSFIIFNWYGILVDLYYYIKSVLIFNKLSKNKYENFELKIDWVGMGYLVLNYGENFFNDLNRDQQEMWIYNDLGKLSEDIAKNDLLDSLKNSYSMITIDGVDTFSILVTYRPYFYYMSPGIIFRSLIIYSGLFFYLI